MNWDLKMVLTMKPISGFHFGCPEGSTSKPSLPGTYAAGR